MKVSKKIHSGIAIVAAVVTLAMMMFSLMSIATTVISNSRYYDTDTLISLLSSQLTGVFTSIMVAVVLFRRKKDIFGGIVFALAATYTVLFGGLIANLYKFFLCITSLSTVAGNTFAFMLIGLTGSIATTGFRTLAAIECFKPGAISGGKVKVLLVILPATAIVMSMLNILIPLSGASQYMLAAVLPALISAVTSVGWVLTGIAFSIPVYEQTRSEFTSFAQPEGNY